MKKCLACNSGTFVHDTTLYDYYSCGHAYQKPLSARSKYPAKWVYFPSPYKKVIESYLENKKAQS